MKDIAYKHSWSSKETEKQEMARLYGKLLHAEDTSASYETETSEVWFDGRHYYWLDANGCSCWDGDYDGWQLTKLELLKMAEKIHGRKDNDAGSLVADWVVENIK